MNPTIRKCLEALSLKHSQRTKPSLDKVEFIQPPLIQQELNSEVPLLNTPVVPFEPIKSKECQAYYNMSEGMKKILCSRCDKKGHVISDYGHAICQRYKT